VQINDPSVQLDHIDYPIIHFFFPFFFFTPPVDALDVLGKLEPCRTGETAAACAWGAESAAEAIGAAAALDGRRQFIIFWIRERLSASKRPRKIDEWVLNFRHCVVGVLCFAWRWQRGKVLASQDQQKQFFAKRIRTVTSSVILRTSLPFEDLHFMLYRVSRGRQTEIHSFERSRERTGLKADSKKLGWAYLSGWVGVQVFGGFLILLPRADVHHSCTVYSEGVMGINASPKSIEDFGWMNPEPTADSWSAIAWHTASTSRLAATAW
jgi:hypothetical protein